MISAPAGFGKTTLLSELVQSAGCAKTWLTLDEEDNDPVRFLRYLSAALSRAGVAVQIEISQALLAPLGCEMQLASWINQIADSNRSILLALDDYHRITAQPVHNLLAYLLDHQPPNLISSVWPAAYPTADCRPVIYLPADGKIPYRQNLRQAGCADPYPGCRSPARIGNQGLTEYPAPLSTNDPLTGEWNDSLSGEYLWTNVNFGEAVSEVMTPLTWSLLRRFRQEWADLQSIPVFGNLGGHLYLNVSYYASAMKAIGKSQTEILASMEDTLHMPVAEGMDIPVVPIPKSRILVYGLTYTIEQFRWWNDARRLPAFLAATPTWCRAKRQQIAQITQPEHLRRLWEDELLPHSLRGYRRVLGSAMRFTGYASDLRQDLNKPDGCGERRYTPDQFEQRWRAACQSRPADWAGESGAC